MAYLSYFLFLENAVVAEDEIAGWILDCCRVERDTGLENYRGTFANAIFFGASLQRDEDLLVQILPSMLAEKLLPDQPAGMTNHWEEMSDAAIARYHRKHVGNLRRVYLDMKDLLDGHLNVVGTHLDLGCGSGILGEVFKRPGWRMIGVDGGQGFLSPAEAIYDEIIHDDLQNFLRNTTRKFDLVTFGGVLQYFHYPADVFALVSHALTPGGYLGFNTIKHHENGAPFAQSSVSAVAHSLSFIHDCLRATGFDVVGGVSKSYWDEHPSDVVVGSLGPPI